MKGQARGLAACVLLWTACQDEGKAQYQQAFERYQSLVGEGKLPSDPAFDGVLAQLEAIPGGSSVKGKADSLHGALLRSRHRLAPKPLAEGAPKGEGSLDTPSDLQAKQQECAQLAKLLGQTPAAERAAVEHRLQECRRDLARLEEKAHDEAAR